MTLSIVQAASPPTLQKTKGGAPRVPLWEKKNGTRKGGPPAAKNIGAVGQDDFGDVLERFYDMTKFCVLDDPDDGVGSRRARWNQSVRILYDVIRCPLDPGHQRAGVRLTPASLVLPDLEPYNFVWGPFVCLVQRDVLQLFREAGFTGFSALPAEVKFKRSSKPAPKFWELVATGSAGRLSPESGFRVLRTCPGCGIQDTTEIKEPEKLIDESEWDGSDFFQFRPGVHWIFVTDRVVQTLSQSNLKGWKAFSLAEMKETFDITYPGDQTPQVKETLRQNGTPH